MKIGKMLVGGLLASSSIGNTSSTFVKMDYGSYGLAKTFEVAEVPSQKLAGLSLVNQEFTDIYGVGEPIKCPGNPAECTEKLLEQLEICATAFTGFPPALAICVAAAWGAYYLCMKL